MKRISLQFAGLLAALFLFAFSCQDHVAPEPETPVQTPKVQTVALSIENQNLYLYRYKLNVENVGNVQITGFGIVYSVEFNSDAPFTKTPTIADNKVVFPLPISKGENSKVDGAPLVGYKTIYYRAYVTYGVNSVAYGNVLEFSPENQKILASIKTNANSGSNPTDMTVNILEVGNIPIEEYGIVYSTRKDRYTEPINDKPTIADSKLLSSESKTVGFHYVTYDFLSSNFADVYYRAYLKHTNGDIVYGDVLYYVK
ncbi:hypothetical protein [Dyadobacter sp. CY326]|uniref:hypothetical protein n=1 Tax=Dyadobacter sp. CY326 TaxID=2907300 RepID=UPI001F3205C4|nr:hypothetical protein [Dyadobacter sp. CY326]MCE7068112.1 hypothetical protein [Dyadobacter sp. CY326]